MEDTLLFCLLVFSALSSVATQQGGHIVGRGSSLTPTGNLSWPSPSGLFAFGFYEQGNSGLYRVGIVLAGFPENTVVWTSNRDDPPVSSNVTLTITEDGRFILQQSQASSTNVVAFDQSVSTAAILDSGNLVLYDSNQEKIWQSFDHPTNAILLGQPLLNNQELFSSMSETDYSTGIFKLQMQSDSNLLLYAVETTETTPYSAYWATNTMGKGGVNVTLNLDGDGHLYLLNNSATILHNLTNGFSEKQKIYLIKLDVDGILRMYSFRLDQRRKSSSVEWASSQNNCDAKGLCGLNGCCTLNDDKAKCVCLPGFDFVVPGNWKAGCERIFLADSCKNKDKRTKYSMTSLENTRWENVPYFVLKTTFKEDCAASCLEDCNCEAAFFNDGMCSKQRLPLRYRRRFFPESNIAFIKWASPMPAKEASNDEPRLRFLSLVFHYSPRPL